MELWVGWRQSASRIPYFPFGPSFAVALNIEIGSEQRATKTSQAF
ncbi:hypothetical protein BRAO375_960036 [Bradyrhizobium sp. ORS 375]|nr:hypothetical protein BRAO375_960036 [Bradyrhizobium sp. ORS 375]